MAHPPWHALKMPLLLLLATTFLAGAGVWWSADQLRAAESARKQQAQASQTARHKLQRSSIEKQLIQQHLAGYQALAARGFIGPENRLAWLEAAQQANRDTQLYGLDYSLEPRTPIAIPSSTIPLGQSPMKLRMPILVEDDLARFLQALQQRTGSVFRVRTCQIARLTDTPPQALNRPELEAECELLWFTVAPVTRTVQ